MAIVCDANKLPEEVKIKAHEYVEKRKPRFRTFGATRDDVEDAWLNGFAFYFEENAKLKAQIDKMKRHSNCKHRSEYNEFDPYSKVCQSCCNLEKWEFGDKEND